MFSIQLYQTCCHTEDGMIIDVRLLQSSKALLPINVIFEVVFTVFKQAHPENA